MICCRAEVSVSNGQSVTCRTGSIVEILEARQLLSASYVKVGVTIQPSITSQVATYFSKSLPAGDYLIAVVGGSLTYKDSVKRPVYRVNDFSQGDFGYKVVQTGAKAIDAPGLSVPKASGAIAAADSVGVSIKFRHSVSGKIGIELLDQPFDDNAPGPLGAPVFVLKERITSLTPAVEQQVAASQPFSNKPIVPADNEFESLNPPLLW